MKTIEQTRLEDARTKQAPWKKWGPYLSERQWGTVREDYSENGDAWNYFSHDQARSRAYHWGEDGLAGISDDKQRLCFALALWNGKDPILKERLFGLTNNEGNHGEDVKEYYFYIDSTPTHSYMKYLYKYPQAAFPYDNLVQTNHARSRQEFEYELINTGVFDQDRYFDVFVEYAKESPEGILIQISIHNRGPEPAEIHVLPTLWFRNRWAWGRDNPRPLLQAVAGNAAAVKASEAELGERHLYCDGQASLLFTENETNAKRLFDGQNRTPFVKDAINNFIVHGESGAVNPAKTGTKVAAHYKLTVPPGKCEVVRLRLTTAAPGTLEKTYGKADGAFGKHFDEVLQTRRQEADEFYAGVIPKSLDADAANVMRQALAGMLWSKQYFYYDVNRWLEERGCDPYLPAAKKAPRNAQWHHMYNADVISMPDKWEYPWYAAWDLAFHVLPLTLDKVTGSIDLTGHPSCERLHCNIACNVMRMARIKLAGESAVYHCISRIVGGQRLLDDLGKEKFVGILAKLAEFCDVEVITYCIMSNHFHLLLRVPIRVELSDDQLLAKIVKFYGKKGILTVLAQEGLKLRGKIDPDIRESVVSRMGDVSAFMKELKQRFSRWYNKTTGRFGTLWAERFTSVVVEDSATALRTVAAYIDLNPIRAGLVQDPKDYRFCGYAAALTGATMIRQGLMSFLEPTDWGAAAAKYRMILFVAAGSTNRSDKAVLDPKTIRAELARGGELSLGQVLRLRVRHMTDGVVLGSKDFVNEMFTRHRDRFSAGRKDGARPIRGVPLPGICVMRDLRVDAIG